MKGIKKAIGNSVLYQQLITILVVGLLLLIFMTPWSNSPFLEFDKKINILAFVTLPTLIIALIQLRNNIALQKASLVKDFVSKLYSDKEFSQSYHYLIYTFTDKIYKEFEQSSPEMRISMQSSRTEGCRFYLLDSFQGTEEERRLDSLLGFFDIIGYHYWVGAIEMRDIAKTMGGHLTFILKREFIRKYLNETPQYWKEIHQNRAVPIAPFRFLSYMLKEFEGFNNKEKKMLEDLNNTFLVNSHK